jgi:hypothetical protein
LVHPELCEGRDHCNRHLALCADLCNVTMHRESVEETEWMPMCGLRESAPDIPSGAHWGLGSWNK